MPARVRAGAAAAQSAGVVVDDDDMADGDTIEMINLHAPKQECVLKILLVGGKQVGKTSFIRRFADKPFPRQYVPTIGFDLIVIPVFYAGRKVFLHFWDVSHEEVRASAGHHALLCHNVAGVFYVLDVSSKDSLVAVDEWHRLLAKYIPSRRVPRLLLAHKADLPPSSWVVSERALEGFVRDAGLTDWCYTVGHEEFGDYVAHRGYESKSVSDAVHMLVDHIFKNNGSHSHGGPALLQGRGHVLGEEAMDEWYGWDQQPHAQQHHRGASSGSLQPPQGWLPSVDIGELCSRSKRLLRSPSGERLLSPRAGETSSSRARRRIGPGAASHEHAAPRLLLLPPPAPSPRRSMAGEMQADSGWRHYAGWIDRDKAMRLLKREPVGAFLLRRKNEASLVLTYKTQHSIEHAPILFDGKQWGPDISVRPPQPGGGGSGGGSGVSSGGVGSSAGGPSASPLPPSHYPPASSSGAASPAPPLPPVQLKFDTLEGLLRYFSKKASVPSLVFRRKPGTCDYEPVKPQQPHTQPHATTLAQPRQATGAIDSAADGWRAVLDRLVCDLEDVVQAVTTTGCLADNQREDEQEDDEAMEEGGATLPMGTCARREERLRQGWRATTGCALLELSRRTRDHLLLPKPTDQQRASGPAKRLEGADLAAAIRGLEQRVDGLLLMWAEDGREVGLEQEQRSLLMSWRPVLRVLRLRME